MIAANSSAKESVMGLPLNLSFAFWLRALLWELPHLRLLTRLMRRGQERLGQLL